MSTPRTNTYSIPCCIIALSSLLCLALSLSGCTFPPRIYRMDVRQGNYMTAEMIRSLRVGMSRQAVLDIMGTPAVDHFFERDQWDYYYYLKRGNGDPVEERRMTVYFSGNHVSRLEGADCCDPNFN